MKKFTLYPFDEKFQEYLSIWLEEHGGEFSDIDQMEMAVPDVYLQWLNQPADWLDGQTPMAFFEQFEDAQELIDWVIAYEDQELLVPDPLLERITQLRDSGKRLFTILRDRRARQSLRMMAANLLEQMEPHAPANELVEMVCAAPEDEVAPIVTQLLINAGPEAIAPIMQALESRAKGEAADFLALVMIEHPGQEAFFQWLVKAFEQTHNKELYAAYLGGYGDERAIEALEKVIGSEEIDYVTYIEIRNAIERLGGRVEIDREFPDDEAYRAMSQMDMEDFN